VATARAGLDPLLQWLSPGDQLLLKATGAVATLEAA